MRSSTKPPPNISELIRKLADQGVPRPEIAARLKVSRQLIHSALQRTKVRGRPTSDETCPLCGAPPSAQRRAIRKADRE